MFALAPTQLQLDYANLTPSLREYFEGLADTSSSKGVDYFEKVPAELRGDSSLVDAYLNGGTVEVPVWVDQRGAAGGQYETVEYTVPDRDWSHDVSRANGGSDASTNGRFEEASVNRSRGADNTTVEEQSAADEASQFDAELLEKGTLVEDLDEATGLTAATEVTSAVGEVVGTGLEFAADFLAPVVGGVTVGKVVADQFETTETKVLVGGGAGVATALLLATPVGQLGLAGYVSYKLYKRGQRFFRNRSAT